MPRPPAWAMAMASRLSVTVSMAADTSGMFRLSSRVKRVVVLTCPGMTSDGPGSSKTSSKVSPSRISMRLSILRGAYSLPGGFGEEASGRRPNVQPQRRGSATLKAGGDEVDLRALRPAGLGLDVTD